MVLCRTNFAPVTTDGSPIITREHPCKCAGAEDVLPATMEVGDEEGEGELERGGLGGVGGGGGAKVG